jgi:energy-coupling factor transport system permease protein
VAAFDLHWRSSSMTISSPARPAGPVGPAGITAVAGRDTRWRTRDIVIVAIIGVAFGVVFWAWNLAWTPLAAVFAFAPWAQDLLYAVWLVPAVLAPLIVRKPGAALFAEMVAAGVEAFMGGQWGADTLLSGFVQGAAAELIFAFTLYRSWSYPVIALAALASAAAAWIHDWVIYYPDVAVGVQLVRGVMLAISAVVIVAGGSVLLVRSLRAAGVLEGFPAGSIEPGENSSG